MTSGLLEPRFARNLSQLAAQYAALAADAIEDDRDGWFSTHPYGPMRLKALHIFQRARSRRRGTRQLESQVAEILSLMEPSFLNDQLPWRDEVREFLALGGISVALADRKLEASELDAITAIVGRGPISRRLARLARRPAPARRQRLEELAAILTVRLSRLRRRRMVEDLAAIALADGRSVDAELDVLHTLAALLDVDTLFVEQTLGRLAKGLD
jgi:uncharacterized tellurite resistance protein B-like protein